MVSPLRFALGLPRPAALYLDHQRPAQEGADEHQQAQDSDALQGSIQRHRAYDVCRYQGFQTQKQSPAQANLELCVESLVFRAKSGRKNSDRWRRSRFRPTAPAPDR